MRTGSSFVVGIVMSACSVALATDAFSEFAYRDIQVQLLDAKGHAVAHAAVYGFCRELNLICPRRDEEPKGHNDVLWRDSFLGKRARTQSPGCKSLPASGDSSLSA